MIDAILSYSYMQNALIAGILASIIGGIMGTIIVEKKLVGMSGGIAHASFGGIGAGYFLQIEPIIGGMAFALFASLSVGRIRNKIGEKADTVVSMFWSGGMALGILFIALTPGYPPDMTSYLFGDILTVNRFYLRLMVLLALVVFAAVIPLFSYWKIYLFDEEYAKIIGIKTIILEFVLYSLMAFTIVVLIKVVGVILSIAVLSIPPAISRFYTYQLGKMMLISTVLGSFFILSGLALSYYLRIPSGATIIMVAIASYVIGYLVNRYERKVKRNGARTENAVKR